MNMIISVRFSFLFWVRVVTRKSAETASLFPYNCQSTEPTHKTPLFLWQFLHRLHQITEMSTSLLLSNHFSPISSSHSFVNQRKRLKPAVFVRLHHPTKLISSNFLGTFSFRSNSFSSARRRILAFSSLGDVGGESPVSEETELVGEDSAAFELGKQKITSWVYFSIVLGVVLYILDVVWIDNSTGFGKAYIDAVSTLSQSSEVIERILFFGFKDCICDFIFGLCLCLNCVWLLRNSFTLSGMLIFFSMYSWDKILFLGKEALATLENKKIEPWNITGNSRLLLAILLKRNSFHSITYKWYWELVLTGTLFTVILFQILPILSSK